MKYTDGSEYQGNWVAGKKEGHDIYRYRSGSVFKVYEGNLRDDKKVGHGVMKYTNGGEYNGNWVADERKGNGIYRYPAGSDIKVYSGN